MEGLGNSMCLALSAKQVQTPSLSHTQAIKRWLSWCSLYLGECVCHSPPFRNGRKLWAGYLGMCINMLNSVLETHFHLGEACWTQAWAFHSLHTKCVMQTISSPLTIPMLLWGCSCTWSSLSEIPDHMVTSFRKHLVTWH